MAVKIILLSIIASVVLLLMIDTYPANESFNTCYVVLNTNNSKLNSFLQKLKWSTDQNCKTRYDQITSDLSCIDKVRGKYITGSIFFWFSPDRPRINNIIRRHNQFCTDMAIPIYEFDITTDQSLN